MTQDKTSLKDQILELLIQSLPILVLVISIFVRQEIEISRLTTKFESMTTENFTYGDSLLLKSWAVDLFSSKKDMKDSLQSSNGLILLELRQINEKLTSLSSWTKETEQRLRDVELKAKL